MEWAGVSKSIRFWSVRHFIVNPAYISLVTVFSVWNFFLYRILTCWAVLTSRTVIKSLCIRQVVPVWISRSWVLSAIWRARWVSERAKNLFPTRLAVTNFNQVPSTQGTGRWNPCVWGQPSLHVFMSVSNSTEVQTKITGIVHNWAFNH